MRRGGFATEKHRGQGKKVQGKPPFYDPFPQKRQEFSLVIFPGVLSCTVFPQHLPGRGKKGFMAVFSTENALQKEPEIFALCESSKLRGIAQPDIDDPFDTGFFQFPKKLDRKSVV